MANFCNKCGNRLDIETGLCPNCDREKFITTVKKVEEVQIKPVASFCNKCGNRLDIETGLCLNCDSETFVSAENKHDDDCTQVLQNAVKEETAQPANFEGVDDTYCGFAKQNNDIDESVKANSKPEKSSSVGTTVLSVFLSFCLVFYLLFAVALYNLRSMTDKAGFEAFFDDIKATDYIYDSGFVSDGDIDEFYEELSDNFGTYIEDKQIDKFVDKSTIKEFMAEKSAEFFEDYFEGKDSELVITRIEVVNLLYRNSDKFEREMDTPLTTDKINNFADWLCGDKGELVVISTEMLEDDLPGVHFLLSIGLSYITIAVFVILSLLCIALMLRNSLWQGMFGIGVSFIVFSSITGFIGLFAGYIPYLWSLMTSFAPFAGGLVGILMTESLLISFVLFVLGIALIVSRKFLRKYFNS